MYRSGWTHLDDPAAVEVGLEQLTQFGWLAEEVRRTGGRNATVFRINPKLRELSLRGADGTARSPGVTPPADAAKDQEAQQGTDRTDRSSETTIYGQVQTEEQPTGGPDRADGRSTGAVGNRQAYGAAPIDGGVR